AHQVALMLFQFGFEALLQGEGIGRGTGKTGQDLVMVEAPDFAGGTLDDDIAQGDLTVAPEGDRFAAPDADDGGGVKLFHAVLSYRENHMGAIRENSSGQNQSP